MEPLVGMKMGEATDTGVDPGTVVGEDRENEVECGDVVEENHDSELESETGAKEDQDTELDLLAGPDECCEEEDGEEEDGGDDDGAEEGEAEDGEENQEEIVDTEEYYEASHAEIVGTDAAEFDHEAAFTRAVRSKSMWEYKIHDKSICKKWKSEAVAMGGTPEAIDSCIQQLRSDATYIRGGLNFKPPAWKSPTRSTHSEFSQDLEKLRRKVAVLQPHITGKMEEPLEETDNEVWFVDNAVPPKLREILENRLDAIANSPEKDFHPDSNNQVQDLIHPSLFPYIEGKSPVKDKSLLPPKSQVIHWTRQYEDSTYQWLPAQFAVDKGGSVKITSYINNLDKASNADLYTAIELIFQLFLPMFEQVLGRFLRGRELHELQVIVKAANYILQPNGETFEGVWHVEGMSHEHIVASGIYYYSSSPSLKDAGLEFRRERNSDSDYPEAKKYHMDDADDPDFPVLEGLQDNIYLGAAETYEGRFLVFPNRLQHKVSGLKNESETEVGYRKILVFFLIDPDIEIVSSKHIPEQQWDRFAPSLAPVLKEVFFKATSQTIPDDICSDILDRAKTGFTMEARRHRLELMHERKFKVDHDNEEWEREYSLCEH